ncbi:MAG TPA: dTMP kinase [Smithellaceae bacterium]|nr:dTMP kinase [Smithellaceae bacterium]HPE07623.1 dTMP kinase [Smithellaceae bacterium]HRY37291.1 dTMP kinase [Smithellaceae bacterium]
MNKFITFEGVEGSGKSTQVKLLGEYLTRNNIPVLLTQEPSGTPIGRKIGEILFNRGHQAMCPETELFLFCAARAQHVREVVWPALKVGKYVLCDRFSDATFAYQAAGRGLNPDFIQTINDYCAERLKPDLTLLFDLPVETGLQRAGRRDDLLKDPSSADRFEKEKLDFHNRVRQGYLNLCSVEPERFRVIDASQTVDMIALDVRRHVLGYISRQS